MINKQKLNKSIIRGAEQWRQIYREILSCFDQDKLWEVIHAHNDLQPDADLEALLKEKIVFGELTKFNAMRAAISEDGPDEAEMIEDGVGLSFSKAFITLWDRGALQPLMVVDEDAIPALAQRDMDRMSAQVEAAAPKAAAAPVAPPPPPVDPVAQCVRDFHELGSKAFQAKYLSDTRNRKYYEAAVDSGRI